MVQSSTLPWPSSQLTLCRVQGELYLECAVLWTVC